MANRPPVSPDLLALVAERLLGTPVAGQELQAVADVLNALMREMAPMRAMELANVEPATTCDPRER